MRERREEDYLAATEDRGGEEPSYCLLPAEGEGESGTRTTGSR